MPPKPVFSNEIQLAKGSTAQSGYGLMSTLPPVLLLAPAETPLKSAIDSACSASPAQVSRISCFTRCRLYRIASETTSSVLQLDKRLALQHGTAATLVVP